MFALAGCTPGRIPVGRTGDRSFNADWLAYGIVAFFALNPYIQELVIFHHLHGYSLFLVFLRLFAVLIPCVSQMPVAGLKSRQLWIAWALAFLSAFTYELGQVYALLAGLFLARGPLRQMRAKASPGSLFAAFASIPLVYQARQYARPSNA